MLAGLAVRRAGAGPFRVTDHDVRAAFGRRPRRRPGDDDPFAWSARTARRAIGLAAVRLLAGGRRAPRSRRCGPGWPIVALGPRGQPAVSQLDRWVAGLPPAGRGAVAPRR